MDESVERFFREYTNESTNGKYYKVVALHESIDVDWETLARLAPSLPKGWFELCSLPKETRIQFSLDYWLSTIPYHPNIDEGLSEFFGSLDDIGVYLTQKKYDEPFEAHMVYCLLGNRGFYRGGVGASENEVIYLQKLFPDYILPEDYVAFLRIHNGFCKTTDNTGITKIADIQKKYGEFQALLETFDQVTTNNGKPVNPKSLIPFYESFGMPFYQCFWGEWHPEQEMGNVYYSAATNQISDPLKKYSGSPEQLAFPSFTDWLIFYLEKIDA